MSLLTWGLGSGFGTGTGTGDTVYIKKTRVVRAASESLTPRATRTKGRPQVSVFNNSTQAIQQAMDDLSSQM